jgi:hypothetical protein
MAQATIRYGQLHLAGPDVSAQIEKLGQVVDDLLGLLDDPSRSAQREEELLGWGLFGLFGPRKRDAQEGQPVSLERVARAGRNQIRRMVRESVPQSVLKAARKASEGRIDPWLTPHLARVTFSQGDGPDEVPDLLALVAWTLLQAAMGDHYRVRKCEWCDLPWFTSGQGRYCDRIAPGSDVGSTQTCRRVASLHNFRSRTRGKERHDG